MNDFDFFYPQDWQSQLTKNGHFAAKLELDDTIKLVIEEQNWPMLDKYFQDVTQANRPLFKFLSHFEIFHEIEFIISIRDASNEWEEDGIWHDDGSRKLAFSLSLNTNPEIIEGGVLEIRKKNQIDSFKVLPFAFGEIIIFATGMNNFEHKINKVTRGKRIIIAGWCT